MVWLVHHRDGTCAVKDNKPFAEDVGSVATLCGHHVSLPGGMSRGRPDCAECNSALYQHRKAKKVTAHDRREG